MLSRRTVVWLVPTFLALHNAEEALALHHVWAGVRDALPAWTAAVAEPLTYAAVAQTLVGLSALAFGLAAVAAAHPASPTRLWLLLTLEMAVGLNSVAHLASAALVFRGYGPGLVTAAVVNAPFAIYCVRRAHQERWLSPTALRATLPGALVLHGPILLGALWLAARLSS